MAVMPSNSKVPAFLSIQYPLSFLLHWSSATHFLVFPFFLPGGTHSGICLGHLFSAIHSGYNNITFQIIQNGILYRYFSLNESLEFCLPLIFRQNYLQKCISIAGNFFFTSSLKCHSAELDNRILLINLIVAPCIFAESLQFINQRMHI